jgi:hypothetical protein
MGVTGKKHVVFVDSDLYKALRIERNCEEICGMLRIRAQGNRRVWKEMCIG